MSTATRIAFLALGPAVGLGIARFAYALILPDMRADLAWHYAQAGWMNTTNAAGYLLGALTAAPLSRLLGLRAVYAAGVAACVVTVLAMGLTHAFGWLSAWRLVAGIAGAMVFVAGGSAAGALASAEPSRGGFLVSLFYAGPGLGIALSGITVPSLLAHTGPAGWQAAWVWLGAVAFVLGALSMLGLTREVSPARTGDGRARHFRVRGTLWLLVGYAAFGAGYIGYMTFMFAYLDELGTGTAGLAGFWATIGVAAMLSPWAWAPVIGRARHGHAFAAAVLVTLLGAMLPLVAHGFPSAMLSAVIFGVAFFAVVATTTAYVRRNAAGHQFSFAIGVFTAAFGIGQTAGPVAVGAISDRAGSLVEGLAWSCVCLVLSVALGLVQRDGDTA